MDVFCICYPLFACKDALACSRIDLIFDIAWMFCICYPFLLPCKDALACSQSRSRTLILHGCVLHLLPPFVCKDALACSQVDLILDITWMYSASVTLLLPIFKKRKKKKEFGALACSRVDLILDIAWMFCTISLSLLFLFF
jgi:hypothetical protein